MLGQGYRADFSKNVSNLDAECLRSESFSLCPVPRYGLVSWEEKVTQVLNWARSMLCGVSFLCLGKWILPTTHRCLVTKHRKQKRYLLREKDMHLYNLQGLWMLNYRPFLFLHNWLRFKYSLCISQRVSCCTTHWFSSPSRLASFHSFWNFYQLLSIKLISKYARTWYREKTIIKAVGSHSELYRTLVNSLGWHHLISSNNSNGNTSTKKP